MPSLVHQIAVQRIARDPGQLRLLAWKTHRKRVSTIRRVVDSTTRFAGSEVRPDLVLLSGKNRWNAVEVQLRIDHDKQFRWPLVSGVLYDHYRAMGDLLVLTASKRTARWAEGVCKDVGPAGTQLRLRPVVLAITAEKTEALLDEAHPELAFFAVWAVAKQHGPEAIRVVKRALAITEKLPSEETRTRQTIEIFSILDKRLVKELKEQGMDTEKILESKAVREWRLEMEAVGEARGLKTALLRVLKARGLAVSKEERARIRKCEDKAVLDRWVEKALSASSVAAVLGPEERPASKAAGRRSTRSRTTRPSHVRRTASA